jgi:uncharacterized protein DUF3108
MMMPIVLLPLLSVSLCAFTPRVDIPTRLPFSIGERLTYNVSIERGGNVGEGTMWIEGPEDIRGTSTYRLRFDSRVKVALFKSVSSSSSWFDPITKSSLRYLKHERNLLTHDDVSVQMYPDQKKWTSADGNGGMSPDDAPLDELSFIYFIRTLPLTPGATYRFDRHFDAARNPVVIRVVRPEVISTPLGEIKTILVEMRVRDPKHYKGDGLIRFNFTADRCRLPARIESTMSLVGKVVMTIKSENAYPACVTP